MTRYITITSQRFPTDYDRAFLVELTDNHGTVKAEGTYAQITDLLTKLNSDTNTEPNNDDFAHDRAGRLRRIHDLLSSLDFDHTFPPDTAWGAVLREALALAAEDGGQA
jgi:hypothetical protein